MTGAPAANTLTIGRVELTNGSAPDPGMTWEGDQLSFSGVLKASTEADVMALRDQVIGLQGNIDEPIVPVTWSDDSSVDGFYRVLGTSVGTVGASYVAYWFPFAVDLERVDGWQAPLFEVLRDGAVRTNSVSFTDNEAVALTGLPGGNKVPQWTSLPDGQVNYDLANGSVSMFAGPSYDNDASFYVEAADYYGGAVSVEVSPDEGTTWNTIVGRQVPNTPTWVRMTNDRVRMTLSELSGALVMTAGYFDRLNTTTDSNGTWEETEFNLIDKSIGAPRFSSYTHGALNEPYNVVAGPDGNVWWTAKDGRPTDPSANGRIGKITSAGRITAYWITGGLQPRGLAVGPDNNLWWTDPYSDKVGKTTTAGVSTIYTPATTDFPAEIASGVDGRLWFTSYFNDRINAITTNGTVTSYTDATIDNPVGICQGPDSRMWFTNWTAGSIGAITTNGTVTEYTDVNISNPAFICTGPDGNLWFTSNGNDRIGKITTGGSISTYTDASLDGPRGIATDSNNGLLWFTNQYNNKVSYTDTSGSITTYSDASLNTPWGIVSGSDGGVWLASQGNDRIVTIDAGPVFDTDPLFTLEMGGTLTVNKNSPEVASIKVGSASGSDELDLTLRRGFNLFEGFAASDTNRGFGVYRTGSEDATVVPGGIRATAADTNGNQYDILSPSTVTVATNGVSGISLSSEAKTFSFGVSATSEDVATDLASYSAAYFAAVSHRQQIAAR